MIDAVSVADPATPSAVIDEARSSEIPAVAFDADAPASSQQVYIGTHNKEMVRELGRQLVKFQPALDDFATQSGDRRHRPDRSVGALRRQGYRAFVDARRDNVKAGTFPRVVPDSLPVKPHLLEDGSTPGCWWAGAPTRARRAWRPRSSS